MNRRTLVTATLLMAALIFALPTAGAQIRVLLLPDSFGFFPDGSGVGTDALVTALTAAGYSVTVGPIEYMWYGDNPSTCGFDVVVHLNGATFGPVPPVAGQQALVDFVRSGGGYVGSQWNGFEAASGLLVEMDELVLQLWPGLDGCVNCPMTWTVVPGLEDHPVLEWILPSFAFDADAHNSGPQVEFEPVNSVVLMTSPGDGPAVIVRESEGGRIVSFSVAANWSTELTLQNSQIQQLYINAVSWAAPVQTAWTIDDLRDAVDELKLNKGQANVLMGKLDNAERQIDRGNLKAAENQIRVFVKKVDGLIRSGVLTQGEGETLLAIADGIIADLVC